MAQRGLHESMVGQVLAIVITFPALALVTVILRLYTRLFLIKNASREDVCICIAMAFSIGFTIATTSQVKHGLGRPIATVDPALLEGYFKSLYGSIILYNFGLTFTKLSILLQYVHITVKGRLRKAIWAFIIFVVAYGIETLFAGVFQCTPIAFFWNPTIPGGKCVERFTLYFANAGINIATDMIILLLPILILKDLIMPRMQKYILIGIISLGGAACIASILRLYLLYKFSVGTDTTWDPTGTATWSSVEINVGIICGSVGTLRPLLSNLFPNVFGSRHTNMNGTKTPNFSSNDTYTATVESGRFDFLDDGEELVGSQNGNIELPDARSRGEV